MALRESVNQLPTGHKLPSALLVPPGRGDESWWIWTRCPICPCANLPASLLCKGKDIADHRSPRRWLSWVFPVALAIHKLSGDKKEPLLKWSRREHKTITLKYISLNPRLSRRQSQNKPFNISGQLQCPSSKLLSNQAFDLKTSTCSKHLSGKCMACSSLRSYLEARDLNKKIPIQQSWSSNQQSSLVDKITSGKKWLPFASRSAEPSSLLRQGKSNFFWHLVICIFPKRYKTIIESRVTHPLVRHWRNHLFEIRNVASCLSKDKRSDMFLSF